MGSQLFIELVSSDPVSVQFGVEILNNSCLDVEVAEYSAILDALNSCADLTKDSHLVTREIKFRTLEV